jgi:hypothetical protein
MSYDRAGYERTEYVGEENIKEGIRNSVSTRTMENKI